MAFQNDPGVNYVLDEPAIPYKRITQAYWFESTHTARQRLGLNLRLTYNSARSGFRPDLNPNDAALFGNQALIASGVFDPVGFGAALDNETLASTQISEVMVPQWIGESKVYYLFCARSTFISVVPGNSPAIPKSRQRAAHPCALSYSPFTSRRAAWALRTFGM
jgi:hypothetical protein